VTLTRALLERAYEAAADPRCRVSARRTLFDYEACVTAGRRLTTLDDSVACSILDLDDVHWGTGTHPGSMVWPSALAGQHDQESAAIIGYEVAVRAARAFGPKHRDLWHPSSTAGVLGATAARAVSEGLSLDEVTICLSHATSLVTGFGQGILEEADSAVLHRLNAQRTAQLCVDAVSLRPADEGIEGERGLLVAFAGDPSPITQPMTLPAITEVSFRFLPVSGLLQDLARAASEVGTVAPSDRIEVVLPTPWTRAVDRPTPCSAHDRWWSAQWTAAAYLLGLDPRDDRGEDDEISEVARRVVLTGGEMPSLTVGDVVVAIESREAVAGDFLGKWERLNPGLPSPEGLLD
jgi:2-methylcitrate dehydratase PrpD